jgi:Transposase DDE domain
VVARGVLALGALKFPSKSAGPSGRGLLRAAKQAFRRVLTQRIFAGRAIAGATANAELLIRRLRELQRQDLTRDELLLKLGAAKKEAGKAYTLLVIHTPTKDQPVTSETFHFALDRKKLRQARRREGSYLLRSNIKSDDPGHLWRLYLQLVEVEQAFKELKNDLSIRPIYHQLETRIEAHIFIAFLAYCLLVTLKQRLKTLAPGLTARVVLEKLAAMQMIEVELPTTDDRVVVLSRYTEPEKDQLFLLRQLKLQLPAQPPPKITTRNSREVA